MKSVRPDLKKLLMAWPSDIAAAPNRFCRLYRISELLNFVPSMEKIGRGLHEILLVENSNRVFHVLAPTPAVWLAAIWPKQDRKQYRGATST